MRPYIALALSLASLTSACTPTFLSKYRDGRESSEVKPAAANASTAAHKPSTLMTPAAGIPRSTRPAIFALDQGTFRFQMSYDRVWDATLDVLLRNYNLAIADRGNGLITTEWDSYYLDGKVHRNKLSLRLKRIAGNSVELTVFNNVEALSKLPDGGITEIWLPTDKNKAEIGRIVQNMAIAMGQPKPDLPQELTAGGSPATEKTRL